LVAKALVPSVVVQDPWPGSSTKIIAPGVRCSFIFATSRGWSFAANAGTLKVGVARVGGTTAEDEEQAETKRQASSNSTKAKRLL
jgi:hypothetical protein